MVDRLCYSSSRRRETRHITENPVSLEQSIQELNENIKALIVVMQSGGGEQVAAADKPKRAARKSKEVEAEPAAAAAAAAEPTAEAPVSATTYYIHPATKTAYAVEPGAPVATPEGAEQVSKERWLEYRTEVIRAAAMNVHSAYPAAFNEALASVGLTRVADAVEQNKDAEFMAALRANYAKAHAAASAAI